MAEILTEKGFSDLLPGQKLRRQCVTGYEKLTKPPKNENMTEIIETGFHMMNVHQMMIFCCMNHQKRNLTPESIGVSPFVYRHSVVVITTAQLHSTKPELRFCAGSNPACGVSEIQDGEDL